MGKTLHYILDGHEIKEVDLKTWAKWFETAERQVKLTSINKDIEVSTVFLGLDHSWGGRTPILFETMIFGGEHDQYQTRYATWKQAETGHEVAVQLFKEKENEQ